MQLIAVCYIGPSVCIKYFEHIITLRAVLLNLNKNKTVISED